jgi:hypothetical protein
MSAATAVRLRARGCCVRPATGLAIGIATGVVTGVWLMQTRGTPGLFTGLAAGLAFGLALARQAPGR